MKWRQISKGSAGLPGAGTYRDWKVLLSQEGFHQCVYCTIDEPSFGGLRNFHVEHYKPKSRFPLLENDFNNLFLACGICNSFKGNDWPADPSPMHDACAYPCPAEIDYAQYIRVNSDTGEVSGTTLAMRYVIERLYLNRPQLLLDRRVSLALSAINSYREYFRGALDSVDDLALLRKICRRLDDLIELHQQLKEALPYAAGDVAR